MDAFWEAYHTPEEMQFISNLAHWVEGGLLLAVALLALAEAAGRLPPGRARLVWPALVLVAGAFLLLYLLAPHGIYRSRAGWAWLLGDAQQRQHLVIAGLLLAGGMAEWRSRSAAGGARWLGYVWPAALAVIGISFLLHEQHGTAEAVAWSVTVHRWLGLLLTGAGGLALTGAVAQWPPRWLYLAWPVPLLLSGVLLLAYREPAGAYRLEPSAHGAAAAADTNHVH